MNSPVHLWATTIDPAKIAVTIISFEEQIRGRLARVRAARNPAEEVERYSKLHETLTYFMQILVLPFDETAATFFRRFQQQRIRIGTQDLRIASIALANNCTVITRNRRDFERVPELTIADWSVPLQ